jgi:phospholipid transport system substrate-binding protein
LASNVTSIDTVTETEMKIDRRTMLTAGLAFAGGAALFRSRGVMAASASENAAAAAPIQHLDDALLDVMKNAESLKFSGRYQKLEPILASVFDIPEMTRIAVGPTWNEFSEADKSGMSDVFGRYMTTMYAARFKSYGGENFNILDVKPRDNGKALVITKLTRTDQDPVDLSYLMHQDSGDWRATDVYYNGSISQLAQLRSEFSGALRQGGAAKLKSVLENKIRDLQGGA